LHELEIYHTDYSCSYDYNDTFSVLVGPEEQNFTVHEGVLCSKSKFFRAACCERWKEGQEKVIRLPEVDTTIFQRYVEWAYGDILVSGIDMDQTIPMLAKLYLLADKMDDIKLRNKAISELTSYCCVSKLCPGSAPIILIWGNTTPSSPLRRWIMDILMLTGSRSVFERDLSIYPVELVQQMALKFMQQRPKKNTDGFRARLPEYLEAEDGD
jgi:hypothetical protein